MNFKVYFFCLFVCLFDSYCDKWFISVIIFWNWVIRITSKQEQQLSSSVSCWVNNSNIFTLFLLQTLGYKYLFWTLFFFSLLNQRLIQLSHLHKITQSDEWSMEMIRWKRCLLNPTAWFANRFLLFFLWQSVMFRFH